MSKDYKIEKYNPKAPEINRPMNKKGHGSVMAGRPVLRKGKKVKRA
jgi:hypothetical protein